jgi:hypothetical protein
VLVAAGLLLSSRFPEHVGRCPPNISTTYSDRVVR